MEDITCAGTTGKSSNATQGIFAHSAHRYAQAGFLVYPLLDGDRRPCTRHAFKDATREAFRIESWARWRQNANLAVQTGKEANLSVIDIDLRNGGFNTLAEFERQGKVLPLDAYYTTPGGGWHVLFAYHPALRTGSNRLGPGIDVVNDGAGTPVPPTTLADGRRYIWKAWPADGLKALPPVPRWVLDHIEAERAAKEAERTLFLRPAAASPSALPEKEIDARRYLATARTALDREAQALALACKPGRNRRLFEVACKLGKWIHNGILASDALMAALSDACNHNGLIAENGNRDLLQTVARGLAKSRNDPLPKLAERGRRQMS